jgi:hypothetical protein
MAKLFRAKSLVDMAAHFHVKARAANADADRCKQLREKHTLRERARTYNECADILLNTEILDPADEVM